jgi:NADH-quinone oxidoreductase subunit N
MYFDAPAALPYARGGNALETGLIFVFALIVSPLGYMLIGPLGELTGRAAGTIF